MKRLFFLCFLLGGATLLFGREVYVGNFKPQNGRQPKGWFLTSTSTGTAARVKDGSLLYYTGTRMDHATNVLMTAFPRVNLQRNGDYVTLVFNLQADQVARQDLNFRFGLFDSKGETLAENAGGSNPHLLRHAVGYAYWMSSSPAGAEGNQSRYIQSDGGGAKMSLTSNIGRIKQLGKPVGFGYLRPGIARTVEMELERKGEDLVFRVLLNGNLLDEGRLIRSAPTFRFDLLAFSGLAPEAMWRISDLSVRTNVELLP